MTTFRLAHIHSVLGHFLKRTSQVTAPMSCSVAGITYCSATQGSPCALNASTFAHAVPSNPPLLGTPLLSSSPLIQQGVCVMLSAPKTEASQVA